MEKLKKSGFYGAGLIEINSPVLIQRYNKALKCMGIEATKLEKFNVDMIGWSPEIALERDNIFYLTHSLANPMGIILTIEQKNAPIYFPHHSFDKYMLQELFRQNSTQIMDITTDEAICLDIDNGVSRYKNLTDLLLIDSFEIKMETPERLINAAKEQKRLVKEYIENENDWQEEQIREKIINLAKKYGDLRFRQISISSVFYSNIRLFYTEALGGVYIFRSFDIKNREVIIVCKDENLLKNKSLNDIYHIEDSTILPMLLSRDYLCININYYQKFDTIIPQMLDEILANVVCEYEEIDYMSISSSYKKQLIKKYEDKIPEVYFELEIFEKKLKKSKKPRVSSLSKELQEKLLMPSNKLDEKFHRVLFKLLSHKDKTHPIRLYRYNKKEFYDYYKNSTESKKIWLIKYITKNYLYKKV